MTDTEPIAQRYNERIEKYLNDIAEVFRQDGITVEGPFDQSGVFDGDTRWELIIVGYDAEEEEGAAITFSIIASANGWDDPDDNGVNFMVDMVTHGGRCLGQICPNNYTDDVWVSPDNLDELDQRFEDILTCPPSAWLEKWIDAE